MLTIAALAVSLAGCNDKFFDPTQIGRFRPTPAVNIILDSLGVAEEAPVAWENGEEPRPSDIVAVKADYVLQPGDLVRVSVFELLQEGIALVNDYLVSETGKLSIPDVGVIQAAGLTEVQLEEEIKQSLSPNILREPSVTVTLLNSQQRTFAVLGNGVVRPNRYVIPRYDFRLMDALSTAGAQMQFNVSYVYVSRREEGTVPSLDGGTEKRVPELELVEPPRQSRTRGGALDPLVALLPPGSQTRHTAFGAAPGGGASLPPSRVPSVAPNGDHNPPSRAEIPEPSEPAAQFETEREMLEMIAPSAQSNAAGRSGAARQNVNWPQSAKIVETPTPTGKGRDNDVAAMVMPYGFRLLEPSGPQVPHRAVPQVERRNLMSVPSPVEFGNSSLPAGAPSLASASGGSKANERVEWIFRDGKWVAIPLGNGSGQIDEQPTTASRPGRAPAQGDSVPTEPDGGIEWVFRDGRWIPEQKGGVPPVGGAGTEPRNATRGVPILPVRADTPQAPALPLEDAKLPMDLEWEQAIQTRVIRIPADKLLAGDPRYNVVIKPGDTIHVPVDIIGEFAIMGNVNKSGLINITGRPMTLKMAIAAAGGLGPLAWPKHVEVVRRLGTKKEEIVLVDLDKIASGEQPDFFIKPNDLINVGTEATARWRAVLRNAFRAVYGFGFVYDRNFADEDYGTGFPSWL